ncbi:MAG: hypothetical protein WBB26_03090, partial [Saprospiraceae bacterium]
MKHFYLLISALLFNLFYLSAQQIDFVKTFGNPGYEDIRSMLYLKETNEIVFTGLNKTAGDPEGDVYFTRMDGNGNLLETKFYGKQDEDGGNGIIRTRDGGFLIIGHTEFPTTGIECDAMATRIDFNGNKMWQVNLGDSIDETAYSGMEDQYGNFIIVGTLTTTLNSKKITEGIAFKISSEGKLIKTLILPVSEPSGSNTGPWRVFAYVNRRAARVAQVDPNTIIIGGIAPYLPGSDNAYNGFSPNSPLWKINLDSFYIIKETFLGYLNGTCKLNDMIIDPRNNKILVFGTANFDATSLDTIKKGVAWMQVVHYPFMDSFTRVDPFKDLKYCVIHDAIQGSDGSIYVVGSSNNNVDTTPFWAVLDSDYKMVNWGLIDFPGRASATSVCIGNSNDIYIGGNTWVNGEYQMFVSHVFPYIIADTENSIQSNFQVQYYNSQNSIVIQNDDQSEFSA